MAWNEPGGGRGKDPWGNRGSDGGPPDLDQVVRKLNEKLKQIFGGVGSGPGNWAAPLAIAAVALVILLVWSSAYIVQPPERGVVLRFGAYVTTLDPGLHLRFPPPIESVKIVNVDQLRSVEHKASMLTQDENIVDLQLAVQYRIKDVEQYLFKVVGADLTLQRVTESAIRAVVGQTTLDDAITEGRERVAAGVKELVQSILDQYQAGLQVTSVNVQDAKAPEEVKSAFDDAIKAREDEQRLKNEAEAYQNEVVPKARGGAARVRQDADAYRSRVVARAQGEANRFNQLVAEYDKAPEVTRQRLYIDAVEGVLSSATKVLVDVKGGSNMIYLPLDKLMERKEGAAQAAASGPPDQHPDARQPLTSEQDLRTQAGRTRGSR